MQDRRVKSDFEAEFSNGGGKQGRDFRLGIDSLNIDDTDDRRRPVQTVLLGEEIPIVEHMRGLEGLPDRGGHFFAVPVKVRNFGTLPVRAFGGVKPR